MAQALDVSIAGGRPLCLKRIWVEPVHCLVVALHGRLMLALAQGREEPHGPGMPHILCSTNLP